MNEDKFEFNKSEIKLEKFPERVYYIHSDQDSTVLVAMDVEMRGDYISWFDTVKERIMGIQSIQNPDLRNFRFTRKDVPGEYSLVPMSLEIYKEKVKDKLNKPGDFTDLDSLLTAFESTKK